MTLPSHASAADVERLLRERLAPAQLEVIDDSARHAGHAGAAQGSHFTVRLQSERFVGLSRLQRHRLVYDALAELMTRGIHALAIDARAPGEPQR
jgi:BolA protein